MTYISQMSVHIQQGQRDAAIRAFQERRVLEECAEAIPGFLSARILVEDGNNDTIMIEAEWRDAQSFQDWTRHPFRDAQERDLRQFLAAAPNTRLFHQVK